MKMAMTWTTTKPTKPGYYWWRAERAINGIRYSHICRIMQYRDQSELHISSDGQDPSLLCNWSGEWSDRPIAEPREETDE
jgi:hypothetical protein